MGVLKPKQHSNEECNNEVEVYSKHQTYHKETNRMLYQCNFNFSVHCCSYLTSPKTTFSNVCFTPTAFSLEISQLKRICFNIPICFNRHNYQMTHGVRAFSLNSKCKQSQLYTVYFCCCLFQLALSQSIYF